MKVFTCKDFEGHWPVGVAAVIIAENEGVAYELLANKLSEIGLGIQDQFTLQELTGGVRVLCDGNY